MLIVGLFNSTDFEHITIGTYSYYLLQLTSTPPIYSIFKLQLNWYSASLFSALSLITGTFILYNMSQSKFNRKLPNLGVSHSNVDMNEGYAP